MNRRQFGAAVSSIGLAGVIHNLRVPALALASGTRGSRSRPMGERQFPKNVAGIRIVDSRIAREAAELARESSPPYLFNHAARTYACAITIVRKAAREQNPVDVPSLRRRSQPAGALGDPDRVQPVAGAEFADGIREIVAHRCRGEVEASPDLFGRQSGYCGS